MKISLLHSQSIAPAGRQSDSSLALELNPQIARPHMHLELPLFVTTAMSGVDEVAEKGEQKRKKAQQQRPEK
jgi:hypothetical protein